MKKREKVVKGLFVINPSSGKQVNQAKALQAMSDLLKDGIIDEASVFYTRKQDDAKNRAMTAKTDGYDFIVAVGGDGTVNEVVSGMLCGSGSIPLAIMPSGTTNDFATSAGIEPTVYCLYNLIKDFKVVTADVGILNGGKYFLNVVAGGILSDVAHNVSVEAKTLFGKTAYMAEGVATVTTNGLKTKKLIMEIDGIEETIDVFFFILANSKSVGGFSKICVDAKINDGFMDLCIVKSLDILNVVPAFLQIINGTHKNNKHIEYHQIKKLKIKPADGESDFHLDCDGEYAGVLPADIEVTKAAVKLLLPAENIKAKQIVTGENQSETLTN